MSSRSALSTLYQPQQTRNLSGSGTERRAELEVWKRLDLMSS